jgi:hypothetical protein
MACTSWMPRRRGFGKRTALVGASLLVSCSGKVASIGNSDPRDSGPPREHVPTYAVSAPPPVEASTNGARGVPFKFVDNEEPIIAFAEDAGHLYWIASTYTPDMPVDNNPPPPSIRTCRTESCDDSHTSFRVPIRRGMQSGPWSKMAVNPTTLFFTGIEQGTTVGFCPKEDCSAPSSGSLGGLQQDFAVDSTRLYLPSNSIVASCDIATCDTSWSRFDMKAPPGEDAFTWTSHVALDDDYVYMTTGSRVLRAPKSGVGMFQVLARDQLATTAIALNATSVFWIERPALSGGPKVLPPARIRVCPKSGCDGDAAVVVQGLQKTDYLAVDESFVYFWEAYLVPGGSGLIVDRLSRCAVTGCGEPTVLAENLGIHGPIFLDESFVYFSGLKCDIGETVEKDGCSYLGALPK